MFVDTWYNWCIDADLEGSTLGFPTQMYSRSIRTQAILHWRTGSRNVGTIGSRRCWQSTVSKTLTPLTSTKHSFLKRNDNFKKVEFSLSRLLVYAAKAESDTARSTGCRVFPIRFICTKCDIWPQRGSGNIKFDAIQCRFLQPSSRRIYVSIAF